MFSNETLAKLHNAVASFPGIGQISKEYCEYRAKVSFDCAIECDGEELDYWIASATDWLKLARKAKF